MSTKPAPMSDREAFMAALKLFDRPEGESQERVLEASDDIDQFVDRAFGNVTLPPF